MSGLLSTAISGLQASQNALRTAGHNISNANTAGFNRQQVNYLTNPESAAGAAGYIGNGVTTESIQRVVNQFVTTQLRMDTSAFNQLDKFNNNIGKIDKLLADAGTGLSGSLQSFFAALQNSADDPSSVPARQLVITQTESLAARFNNLHDRLKAVETGINQEIGTITQQMGSLAASVANLNKAIADKGSSGQGGQPNDLLDQRDEALRKLSEYVSLQIVTQSDGNVNVFIGNGQPLVVGQTVSKFDVRDGGQIHLSNGIQSANVTGQITGGQLGGLLQFREEVLNPSMNELGRIAVVMADQFNKLQQQGLDLDGDYGQPMFGDINSPELTSDRVKHGKNALPDNRVLSLNIDDPAQMTSSDYRLQILPNTTNYVITRLDDDEIVSQGILTGAYPFEVSFDGLTVNLQSGSFQGGDTFTLQPTINGARDITAALTRPEDLALAVPIRTKTSLGNVGTGAVSAGNVLGLVDSNGNRLPAFAAAGQLSPPVIIRFTSATTYDVLDNSDPANPKHLNPPMRDQTFIPGIDNPVFGTDSGETRVTGNGARTGLPDGRSPATFATGSLAQVNAYPAEQYTFTTTNPTTGSVSSQVVTTQANASAAQTATMLNNIPGVSANAFTTAAISNININDFSSPLQITVNNVDLLQYTGGVPDVTIPDPTVPGNLAEFNDYLAQQINGNPDLASLGIRAISTSNPITGAPELQMIASSGVNLDVRFTAETAGNSLSVSDNNGNPGVTLSESAAGNQSAITVGGRIDITMADGVVLRTSPTTSQLLGDSTATDFAQSSYLGYQVSIKGQPQAGDTFTIDFNSDASNDNRNALNFVGLETKGTLLNGSLSFSDGYGRLVEVVGTKSNLTSINTAASKSLLEQTQTMRESASGVNLDEEAANLIKFEQMYNANARVISVARELFDTLLSSI